ncbi:YiiG family protein [Paenibacillus elgii]|uniref:YiiG family protein n=1 Tax=Paenibacillus elgii TaxID=189691 RepID=UPI00203F71FF|nr:YiiG family protein [Paenibacillus elgii]MCM3270528.1 YiiG family protein [Paenibacillus elgii]
MKKFSSFVALALLCTMFTACSNLKMNRPAAEPSGTTADKPSGDASGESDKKKSDGANIEALEEAMEVGKYNAYVGLNNFMTGRLDQVLTDYFDKFGDEEQPVIDKNFSFTMLSISSSDAKALETQFGFADKAPAFPAIDPVVVRLKPAMNDLTAILSEAREYYKTKGYVDDHFAKAKEMHPKIVKAADAYYAVADEYLKAMAGMGAQRKKESLKKFQENDEQIRYGALKFLVDAQALSAEMEEQGVTAKNILDLDMEKFRAKYDPLVDDLKNLTQHAQDEKRLKKEKIESYNLNSYIEEAQKVKVAASDIIERVNKKREVDEFHLKNRFFTENQDGTPEKFEMTLRDAIQKYNRLK